ncbi:MAG: YceI family protein [Chloroflexota bacterium]
MNKHSLNCVVGFAAMAGLCALTACGNPSNTQTTSAGAPATGASTNAPPPPATVLPTSVIAAPTPTSAPVPTAVARPTQVNEPAPTPAPPLTAAAQTKAASTTSGGQSVRLVLDESASQASYHAHEQLVGKTLPSEAVGTSPGVSGSLVLEADGSIVADQSTITVDLTQLKSDESRRDNFVKNETLQTKLFPTATFVPREIKGLPTPLPSAGQATFQVLGDLTVHGVTKPVTWQVTAQFDDTTMTGSATTSVNITDFGMTPPKVGPVLNIEDGLSLELAFTASPTPAPLP